MESSPIPTKTGREDSGNSPLAFATETALTKIKAQQLQQVKVRSDHAPTSILPFRHSSAVTNDDHEDDEDIREYMEMYPQPIPNAVNGNNGSVKQHVEDHLKDLNFKSLSDDEVGASGGSGSGSGVWSYVPKTSCLTSFWYDSVWPGLGLLGESYMLFSIGILRPIWEIVFPDCFATQATCTELLVHSLTYSIIFGIIIGMICIGYASNSLGRRRGSITTASLMCIGSWSLTILSYFAAQPEFADSTSTLFWCIGFSFFIFGVGVGGEYPLSASSASEKAIEELQVRVAKEKGDKTKAGIKGRISKLLRDDTFQTFASATTKEDLEAIIKIEKDARNSAVVKSHRGRRVQLVFSMQGVGIFLNCLIVSGLLILLGEQDENNEYNPVALFFIWQTSYCIGSLILSFVLISRIVLLTESKVWANVKREQRIAEEQKRIQMQEQTNQSPQDEFHRTGCVGSPPQTSAINSCTVKDKNKVSPAVRTGQYSPPDPPGRTNTSVYRKQEQDDESDSVQQDSFLPNKYRQQQQIVGSISGDDEEYSFSDTVSSMTLPTLVQNDMPQPEPASPLPDRVMVRAKDSTSQHQRDAIATLGRRNSNTDSQYLGPCGVPEDGTQPRIPPQSQLPQRKSKFFARKAYQQQVAGEKYDTPSRRHSATGFILLVQQYGMRLFGVSLSWMLWDVAFYGNKLFQSAFLIALTGEKTNLLDLSIAATINAAVALLGYFVAACVIDSPYVGRTLLQQWGFLVVAILFVTVGYFFEQLKSQILIALYLGTSFVGQLGPNATTFLIPVEVFPTEMRTYCHGIAAACGKVGALIASVVFNYIDNDADLFLLSGYASFAGCLITILFIPDTTGLDLYEYDKKWRSFVFGQPKYVGDADSPKFLSFYERHYNTLVQWICCCCCCSCESTMPLPDNSDSEPQRDGDENRQIETNYASFPDKDGDLYVI